MAVTGACCLGIAKSMATEETFEENVITNRQSQGNGEHEYRTWGDFGKLLKVGDTIGVSVHVLSSVV